MHMPMHSRIGQLNSERLVCFPNITIKSYSGINEVFISISYAFSVFLSYKENI
jgi:hypothetical protein